MDRSRQRKFLMLRGFASANIKLGARTAKRFHSKAGGRRYSGAPWVNGRITNDYAEGVTHWFGRYENL